MTLCCCIAFFLWKSAEILKKTVKISICARCTRTVRKPTHKKKRMKCANLKKRKRIAGSRRNGRIKYVYQENRGLGAARNTGLNLVDTPYVTFINDEPEKEVLLTRYYGIGENVKEMRKIRGKRFAQTKGSISRRCGGND